MIKLNVMMALLLQIQATDVPVSHGQEPMTMGNVQHTDAWTSGHRCAVRWPAG